MKKLSFLLAMIMILSSFVVMPVFAAAAVHTYTEYKYDGTADTQRNTTAVGWYSSANTSSGLTHSINAAAPQQGSSEKAYNISGTSALGYYDNLYTFFSGVNFNLTSTASTAVLNDNFKNKDNYAWSVDVYFPSNAYTARQEVRLHLGLTASAFYFAFRTGTNPEGESDVTYKSIPSNGSSQYKAFYGLQQDRWHNIAVNLSKNNNTLTYTVMVDGVVQGEYYERTSSSDLTLKKVEATSLTATTSATEWLPSMKLALPLDSGKTYNLYYDNFNLYATGTTLAPAAATMATNGDVTVDNSAKTLTVVDTATAATIISASSATAASAEVYRADSSALGYTQVVDGSFATNDIVKIKSTTGAYSYYTLIVNQSATEYNGNTNATTYNFGGLTYANSVQAPLTQDTMAYSVSGTATDTVGAGFGTTLNSADERHYAYKADFYIDSTNNDNKEFIVNAGVDGFLKDFVFRNGEYANTDTCGIDGAKVFYGVSTDKWHKLVIAVDVDDNKIVTITPYIDGVKQEKYHTVTATAVGAEENTAITSASAVGAGYKLQSTIKTDNTSGEKYNFYFDSVSYNALALAYTATAPAEISSAVNGVITVAKDSSDQAPLASEVKTLCAVDSSVTFEVYDSTGATLRADSANVADNDIIKLTTLEGAYSYYTIDVLTRDEYLVKLFNEALLLNTPIADIFESLQLDGYFASADIIAVINEYKALESISDVAYKAINNAFYAKTFTTGEAEIIDFTKETVAVKTVQAMVSATEFGNFVTRVGDVFLDSADVTIYDSLPNLTPAKDQSLVNDAMVKAKAGITSIALLKSTFNAKCIAERDRVIQQQPIIQETTSKGPTYSGGKVTGVVSVPVDPDTTEEDADDYSNTPSPFNDLSNAHWAYNYIMSLVDDGILSGYQDGSFKPEEDVLREEIVKMLIEAFSKCDENATSSYTDFSDSDWFYPYVATAIEKGYINGIAENVFGAGLSVSRQDCVVMIYNIIQKLGVKLPVVRTYTDFADEANIESYAKNAVKALYCAGIIDGTGAGFNPDGDLTRAEAAKIIFSVLKIVKG